MAADPAFLGRGWAFPPSFSQGGADVETLAGAANVAQSLRIIFATELGERPMREDFGAGLSRYLFAPVDDTMLTDLRDAIYDAVIAWEPRIRIDALEIDESADEAGLLSISLAYALHGSNSRYNFVYPFYVRETSGTAG